MPPRIRNSELDRLATEMPKANAKLNSHKNNRMKHLILRWIFTAPLRRLAPIVERQVEAMIIQFRKTIALAVLVALFAGCRGMGTQQFTAFGPAQADELARSCRVVLDVRPTQITVLADYNLWENMQMLAPIPKRWKIDLTLQVERVVHGAFNEPSLQIHWLREPTEEQNKVLGFTGRYDFAIGMPMRVGFDSQADEHLRNLKLMIRNE